MPASEKKSRNGPLSCKKKSLTSEVQNQKSISSFFQPSKTNSATPSTSTLFSKVGQTSIGKLTLKKGSTKEASDHLNSGTDRPVGNSTEDIEGKISAAVKCFITKEHCSFKTETQVDRRSSNQSNFTVVKTSLNQLKIDLNRGNKSDKFLQNEPIVIPETQVCLLESTPKVKGQDDEGIIPDTPQNDKNDEPVKKKSFGRSFLSSGANVSENPYILKKEHVKKQPVSKARKGLISSSFKFNAYEKQDNDTEREINVQGEANTCIENEIEDSCSLQNRFSTNESGSQLLATEKVTPTKVYQGNRSFMKRMSKCGSSPNSKRFVYSNIGTNNGNTKLMSKNVRELMAGSRTVDGNIKDENQNLPIKPEGNHSKEENNLQEKHDIYNRIVDQKENKDSSSQSNSSKCLQNETGSSFSYQLSLIRKQKPVVSEMKIDEDDCLCAILNELDNDNKESSKMKSYQPPIMSLKKPRNSVLGKLSRKEKPEINKSLEESLTEDDIKFLDKIDEKVHQKVNKEIQIKEDMVSKHGMNTIETTFLKHNFVTKKRWKDRKLSNNQKTKESDSHNADDIIPTQSIVEILSQLGKDDIKEIRDDPIDGFSDQLEKEKLSNKLGTQAKEKDVMQPVCVKFGRHKVDRLDRHRNGNDLCLQLTDVFTKKQKNCILSGFWADTHVSENDIVNIVGSFDGDTYHITDNNGLIVVNPDLLLSGTTVVSSVFCMRKGVLSEKFKGCDKGNQQMLYGSIIHFVFQQVLQKGLTLEEQILKEATNIVQQARFLHDMYKSNTTEGEVLEEIKKYIPQMKKWLDQYTNLASTCSQKKEDLNITKVIDIEENIWCPRYGVKGKIDLTVEIQIKNKERYEKCIVPLELKTGRPSFSMEHKGQVTLYSMMSSDRRPDSGQGLLLYLRDLVQKVIPADHLNIRGLIQLRNEMAYFLSDQVSKSTTNDGQASYHIGRLPDPINNQRACLKCAQLTNCCIYQKSIEQKNLNSSMASLVPNTLCHLLQEHLHFYVHWCLMLDLEAKASTDKGGVSDLWCKTGHKREQEGSCIDGLRLSDHQVNNGYCLLTFSRHQDKQKLYSTSINMIGIAVQDYMIISTEKTNHLALCNGTVVGITEESIDIAIESESLQRIITLKEEIFRLDRYSSFSTATILYSNLSKLMMDEPRSDNLRKLIIDRKTPEFAAKLSKIEIEKVKGIFKSLNKPQKTAVLKVLMSKDYVLIKGYPGTGKTATIVAVARVLNLLGLSVLLTSYTHSAVDNILLKLMKHNIEFLRLGKTSKIHPQIQRFSADLLTKNLQTVGDLRQFYSQQRIVATSCLGTNHPVFTQKKFDVCIVDEASQVLLPACLGPLFCADKFVLVGDPKQLPPVMQSREARGLGMDLSLFDKLDGVGGTCELNLQYRMNRQIMALSNVLVYDGLLQCGCDAVASGQLEMDTDHISEIWLNQVFKGTPYKATIFIDTSEVQAGESKDNSGMVVNFGESKIVQKLVSTCLKGGLLSEDIGVIAPYRHQVRVIHDSLSNCAVEVNTVDQYQGRDKELVIISFTRSYKEKLSENFKSGDLLKDVRRLNVAVSRAKKKLIMVGDYVTLQTYQPLAVILNLMKKNDLIVTLSELEL
ncbi:DNA replication ATP-dependent helicase/nuclease DNA2-like isoform X1 [Mytilus trossulus]|uniref:DNA replication ATP-dependent helicase/nuclease DNA2-like isoform X1 n=1 Tax=Mytilus trossulus TaxID=6551 RepID=UPI003005193E